MPSPGSGFWVCIRTMTTKMNHPQLMTLLRAKLKKSILQIQPQRKKPTYNVGELNMEVLKKK